MGVGARLGLCDGRDAAYACGHDAVDGPRPCPAGARPICAEGGSDPTLDPAHPADGRHDGRDAVTTGIGEALREAREQQGRTIEDAARATRVRSDYIRALEEESFHAFGGDVYAKGFLKSYARYLSLDPEPLLEVYRRELAQDDWQATAFATTTATAPPPSRGAPPMWIAWMLVGVLVLAGLFVVGSVFGGRTPAPVAQPPVGPVEDTETSDGTNDDASDTPSEPEGSPSASPTPEVDGVELLVVFEEDCWINVEVDGQQIEQGTIPSGETRSYDGEDTVTIRFGNSGGVRVELNGEDLGPPGERGQPETVTFTEDGAEQAA